MDFKKVLEAVPPVAVGASCGLFVFFLVSLVLIVPVAGVLMAIGAAVGLLVYLMGSESTECNDKNN